MQPTRNQSQSTLHSFALLHFVHRRTDKLSCTYMQQRVRINARAMATEHDKDHVQVHGTQSQAQICHTVLACLLALRRMMQSQSNGADLVMP